MVIAVQSKKCNSVVVVVYKKLVSGDLSLLIFYAPLKGAATSIIIFRFKPRGKFL